MGHTPFRGWVYFRCILRVFLLTLGVSCPVGAAFDAEWTFNNDSYIAYTLTSVSSSDLYAGPLPVNNPTLNLVSGKRYRVTVVNPVSHPLQILAKGDSAATDTVLLYQGGGAGSWESDAGVDWQDLAGGIVEFTLTPAFVAAMNETGKSPGYRCSFHASMMRGGFIVAMPPEPIPDPLPDVPKGDITIELETVIEGLPAPLGVLDTGDTSGSLLVYDQSGLVVVVRNGQRLASPFLDVRDRLVKLGVLGSFDEKDYDERGLLGVALHPNFLTNGRLFTYTSEPTSGTADFPVARTSGQNDHQSVVAEWRVDPQNPDSVLLSSRREILRLDEPQFNHNGGDMTFGPDGYLYIGLGDGGNADDEGEGHATNGNGQSLQTVLGKMLRIAVDGTTNSLNGRYGIPPNNPFVGVAGIDEIYAYGFRNPYRFSFDALTGDLYVGDVGQNQVEEIDRVTLGNNYGWRYREGGFYFDPNGAGDGRVVTQPVEPKPSKNPIDPIAQYDHGDGLAVVGGYVYRAGVIPGLNGRYVFGDFTRGFDVPSGRLFYLESPGNQIREFKIGQTDRALGLYVKGFGQDRQGNVYLCASTALGPYGTQGKVLKISTLPPEPIPNPLPDVPRGNISIEFETVVEGLPAPLGVLDSGENTGRLLVYDQSGLVVFVWNGQRLDPPFLDVRSRLVKLGILGKFDETDYDERGLLGVALHPNFLTNGRLFTYTSEPTSGTADFPVARTSGQNDHQSVVAEWRVDPQNPDSVLLSSRREILRIDEPQFNHNGGQLVFGPDGYLYIGLGDGGNADDQGEGHATYGNGQSLQTVLGKMLRIAVDGTPNSINGQYGIPPDNPFVGGAGIDEIYAYGFRNPYRFSFDALTGELYVGDVGQNQVEEIDRVTLGNNYGWRYREGGFYFDPNGSGDGRVVTQPVEPEPSKTPVDPVAQYDHGDGLAVVGGYVYRAGGIPGLNGRYVFGDFTRGFDVPSGRLFYLESPGNQIREFKIGPTDRSLGLFVKGFGQDRQGNVYLCASTALGPYGTQGKVLKIVAVKKSPLWWIY